MTLAELKEQLVERLKDYGTKISENESVIQLVERYNNFSPSMQKILAGFFFFLVAYIIYSIPAAFIDSSKEYEENFSHNRQLIRELYRSARNPSIPADRFSGQDFEQMKSTVEGTLASQQVIESQKGSFAPANKPLSGNKVPSAIRQTGMTFEIKKLNLKQVVGISEQISAMHPNTKLASMEIRADDADPHYFNVKYTLSSLSLPVKTAPAAKPQPFKRR